MEFIQEIDFSFNQLKELHNFSIRAIDRMKSPNLQ